jgi:predicted component of type VI protein secretion system
MAGESLKVTAGNAQGQDISLEQELVIGRSTPGAGSLGGDSEISRVHARVFRDASGQLTVEDLGSTNGTFVNGNRISAPTPLRPGDEVRFGQTTLSVEAGAAGEGATAVGAPIPPAVAAPPPAPAAMPPTQPLPPSQPPPGPHYGGQQPPYAGGPVGGPPGRTGASRAPWIALAAVVLIALIVGGLAIGGVFSSDNKSKNASTQIAPVSTSPTPATTTPPATSAMPAPPQEPSTPSSGGYPPGFVGKLIQGCDKSGKLTHGQCVCWFNKLKNAYTFPELVTVLKRARSGSIPPKAVALLRTCLSQ